MAGQSRPEGLETADPNHFCNLPASLLRAVKKEQHRHGGCAVVPPRVARAVLHDDVSAFEMNSLGVVKFKPNLTVINYGIVDGVRLVHCRIFFFKVIG